MKKISLSVPAFFLSLLLLNINSVSAQFSLDAQLRTRFEFRDGYRHILLKGDIPAMLISQRTRLGISYKTDRLKLKIVPKDVRIWGDEELSGIRGVNGNDASVDLHEAYAEVKIKRDLWISLGRQELVYDNQSILSNSNWNNHAIASDAIVIKYNRSGLRLHLGGTWNSLTSRNSNNYYPADRLKTLGYLWINRDISSILKLSFLHLSTGITVSDTSDNIRFRHTNGIYSSWNYRYLSFKGNLYYQYGRNQEGKKVSAWLADADLSRRSGILTTGIGLGYATGNSKSALDQKTDRTFYEVYRSTHSFFGYMDYFPKISESTSNGGLADYYFYFDIKLTSKLNVKNTLHYFSLAQLNPNTPNKKHLGYENDLVLNYRFSEWGSVEAGYLTFFPTYALKELQGVKNNKFPQFVYVMLNLTPTLFRQ